MISFLTALLTASTAYAQPISSAATPTAASGDRPYYMDQASKSLVSYALKYRKSEFPEDKASSIATELVNSMLAPAGATQVVQSAVSYVAQSGPTLKGPDAEKLASRANSYYSSVKTQSPYQQFASRVNAQTTAFDVSKAINDAHATAASVGGSNSDRANAIADKVGVFYSSVKADPQDMAAVATGKALASNVAKDFGVNPEKAKSHMKAAKAACKQAMGRE